MSKQDPSQSNAIPQVVVTYEEMLRSDSIGFLEQSTFLKITDYYISQHEMQEALRVIDFALDQHPYSSELLIRKAEIFFDVERFQDALEVLDLAGTLSASDLSLNLLRAEVLSALQRTQEGFDLLDNMFAISSQSDYDEIWLSKANLYEDLEQYHNVFECLKCALELNPNHVEALDRIWLTVEICEAYEESVALHQKIVDASPYNLHAWYNLGHAFNAIGKLEEAAEAYEFCMVIDEQFEFAYRDCADVYSSMHQFHKAVKVYEEAIEIFSADSDLFIQTGKCFERMHDFSKAREYYAKAVRIDSNAATAYMRMGQCFVSEDKWVSALSSFKKAHKIDPKNPDFAHAVAIAFAELDQPENAVPFFKIAIDNAPDDAKLWKEFALFYIDEQDFELALEILEEAMVYVQSADLEYVKSACLYKMGHKQAALLKPYQWITSVTRFIQKSFPNSNWTQISSI